jgi:iron complex transport system substrate-binding protein
MPGVCAILGLCTLLACGPREDAPPDDAPARRIVSLCPSFTETLFLLGRGDRVVGRTRYCDAPAGTAAVPVVGDAIQVNVETLVARRPDLVVTSSRAHLDALAPLAHRFRVRHVPGDSVEDVLAAILTLGRLAEAETEAGRLVARLRRALAEARARSADRDRPRVLFLADHDPFFAAGGPSYVGTLIDAAGGTNVAADLDQAYPSLSLESILARAPEVIIEGVRGDAAGDAAVREFWERFPDIPAVRDGRVHRLPSDAAVRPGPRLPQALRELEALLHPETPR